MILISDSNQVKNLLDFLTYIKDFFSEELPLKDIVYCKYYGNFQWAFNFAINDCFYVKFISKHCSSQENINIAIEKIIYETIKYLKSEILLSFTPSFFYCDQKSALICKYPREMVSLAEHYNNSDNQLNKTSFPIGINLAKFHLSTMHDDKVKQSFTDLESNCLNHESLHQKNFPELLTDNLQPKHLKFIPAQSWRFIGLYQTTGNIKKIVENLIANQKKYCLVNNNLKFKNILISRKYDEAEENPIQVKFLDWSHCNWGDPANDLGKTIGGYFLIWLNSMLVHFTIEPRVSIQTATISLETILAAISSLMKAYISVIPNILEQDSDFLLRSMRFAGVEIICQLLEEFHLQHEEAVKYQMVYFHIASQLISKPEKFISIRN